MIRPVRGTQGPTSAVAAAVSDAAGAQGREASGSSSEPIPTGVAGGSERASSAPLNLAPLIAAQDRTTHAVRAIARVLIISLVGGLVVTGLSILGAFAAAAAAPAGPAASVVWTAVFSVASGIAALVTVIIAITKAREELKASER